MYFEIRHEQTWIKIVSAISCLLSFEAVMMFCLMTENLERVPVWLIAAFVLLMLVLVAASALYFIEQAVGTRIAVEGESVTVRHLFGKKQIALDSIRGVQIERYRRARKKRNSMFSSGYHFLEYRLRMTIHLMNAKDVVLTDTAMTEKGGIFGNWFSTPEPLPDEDVPLYNAYQVIQTMRNVQPQHTV